MLKINKVGDKFKKIEFSSMNLLDVRRTARAVMSGVFLGQLLETKPIIPQIKGIIENENGSYGNSISPIGEYGGFDYRTGDRRIVLNGDASRLTVTFGGDGSFNFAGQIIRYALGPYIGDYVIDNSPPNVKDCQVTFQETQPGDIGQIYIQPTWHEVEFRIPWARFAG